MMWRNHCICQWSFESHRFVVVNRLQPSQHEAGSTVPYEHGRSGPISESKGHSYTDSTCNDISHVLSQIRCLRELLLQAAIAILPQQSSKPQHSASLWDTAGQFITVMCLDSGTGMDRWRHGPNAGNRPWSRRSHILVAIHESCNPLCHIHSPTWVRRMPIPWLHLASPHVESKRFKIYPCQNYTHHSNIFQISVNTPILCIHVYVYIYMCIYV